MTEQAAENFELHERLGKSMFSNGVTPDNVYRLVKALEKIATELEWMNANGVRTRGR